MIAKHDRFIAVNMGSPRAYARFLATRVALLGPFPCDCDDVDVLQREGHRTEDRLLLRVVIAHTRQAT